MTTANSTSTNPLFSPNGVLGSGSFSTVHYAIHTPTSHPVALKILDGHAIHDDPSNKKRVLREIHHLHIASNHGNIVTLYDVYSAQHIEEGKKWQDVVLAMEFVGGGDLHDYVTQHGSTIHNNNNRWTITALKNCFASARDCSGGLPPKQVQSFMKQILSGLSHLHSHNIVHRDLKLDNLLLSTSKSRILIADLGLSAIVSPHVNDGYLTTACGSPHYAAPEILVLKPYRGYPIDVWSLGVILYCMICGRLPFRDEDVKIMFNKIKRGQFERMRWWSKGEKEILEGMIRVNVGTRWTLKKVMDHSLWKGDYELNIHGDGEEEKLQEEETVKQVDNDNDTTDDNVHQTSIRTSDTIPSSCNSSLRDAEKELENEETDTTTTLNDDEYHQKVVDQLLTLYKESKVEITKEHSQKEESTQEIKTVPVTKEIIKNALLVAKQMNKECILHEMEGKEDDDILTILNDHHENNEVTSSSSSKRVTSVTTATTTATSTVTIKDLICTYQILLDDEREKWMQQQKEEEENRGQDKHSDRSSVRKIAEGLLPHFGLHHH